MSEARLSAGRRVSFLIAEKSYHRRFIGLASKIAQSSKSVSYDRSNEVCQLSVLHLNVSQSRLRDLPTMRKLAKAQYILILPLRLKTTYSKVLARNSHKS